MLARAFADDQGVIGRVILDPFEPVAASSERTVDLTPDGDATLLYMHIPKVAGTSMRTALGQAYSRTERAYIYDPLNVWGAVSPSRFADLPERQRRDLRLVLGHFSFGIHAAIPNPAAYVALVRDPFDRVVSLYQHYRAQAGIRGFLDLRRYRVRGAVQTERELFRRFGSSLEGWVFEAKPLEVDNGMVRRISARQGVRFGECPDDLLAEALHHIDAHFAALLVLDDPERSVRILRKLLGRPLPALSHQNMSRRRQSSLGLDARVRERIAELNRLDTQLHRIALERLPEAWARLGLGDD